MYKPGKGTNRQLDDPRVEPTNNSVILQGVLRVVRAHKLSKVVPMQCRNCPEVGLAQQCTGDQVGPMQGEPKGRLEGPGGSMVCWCKHVQSIYANNYARCDSNWCAVVQCHSNWCRDPSAPSRRQGAKARGRRVAAVQVHYQVAEP